MATMYFTKKSGFFDEFRRQQAVIRMHDTISDYLNNNFYNDNEIKNLRRSLKRSFMKEA